MIQLIIEKLHTALKQHITVVKTENISDLWTELLKTIILKYVIRTRVNALLNEESEVIKQPHSKWAICELFK